MWLSKISIGETCTSPKRVDAEQITSTLDEQRSIYLCSNLNPCNRSLAACLAKTSAIEDRNMQDGSYQVRHAPSGLQPSYHTRANTTSFTYLVRMPSTLAPYIMALPEGTILALPLLEDFPANRSFFLYCNQAPIIMAPWPVEREPDRHLIT